MTISKKEMSGEVDVDELMEAMESNNTNVDKNIISVRPQETVATTSDSSSKDAYSLVGQDLVWSGVGLRLLEKKNGGDTKLHILKDVWGKAEAGKTTAIMGASGAGKTSLFQTLAGRIPSSGKLRSEGDIFLGGARFDPTQRDQRKLIAYVSQEDALQESSTPREAIYFSARLRLPKRVSDEECTEIVNAILTELGLDDAADTLIGGGFNKGISGGEKRRVSIGVELVAKPTLIFLDEPTSGLDSFAAAQVMKLLSRVAHHGSTVLFTIHQPSSNIFGTFDRLILLNKGRVMHQGEVANLARDFEQYGYPVPNQYNPADWVIDIAQGITLEELEKAHFFASAPDNLLLAARKEDAAETVETPQDEHVSMWTEFVMLQNREMADLRRNPAFIVISIVVTGILSLIFGVIFFDIGRQDRSEYTVIQSQLGAVVNVLISTMMGQSNPAMLTFSKDRPVFLREFSTDHYTVIPYFLSKLWREMFNTLIATLSQALVIYWMMGFQMSFGQLFAITYALSLTATAVAVMLGACFDDVQNALTLFTLVVVPQFFFSGLFIAIELIPSWVSWAQYVCSLTYAARLGFAYEFADCEPGDAAANCAAVLAANNVDKDSTWWYWLALLGLFVMFRGFGALILRYKATY
ncbi:Putative white-brown complex homolog protein 30 [Seminavis robusta]|uniref:White-brown complex homolog protein 30 n=1 Tax=Seminavis robusta TaxID=568900 RepID=A0A9N8HI72_9STRA|nr:Putative white-brown complex homolog protein 30 [Seminavis robusta]|eukprot:Sro761_g198570.1 Putative white-brown complex homolog protein 30 (637) ;mRNA; r:37365-39785